MIENKLKTVLVEDEADSREILESLLERFVPDVELIGMAEDVDSGLALIRKVRPDLVLLDVEMRTGSGFDILNALSKPDFEVVFITAHQQYAIEAIRHSALDYLLKPVNIEELQLAVQKAIKSRKHRPGPNRIEKLLSHLLQHTPQSQRISLPTNNGLEFLDAEEIMYLKSDGAYTRFLLTDGREIMTSRNLKHYLDQLEPYHFLRIHKSHIINLNKVRRYFQGKGGQVQMEDGTMLEVARARKQKLLDRL